MSDIDKERKKRNSRQRVREREANRQKLTG